LDAREHETSDHSQRVVRYTVAIARRMSIPEDQIEHIGRGALLHDIGKIGVPDSILLKPGPLTNAEWTEMRKHPEVGYRILESIDFLRPAAEIVLAHQERWDGNGYPRGLTGESLPLGARIFMIADTLDAMTSDRPYRRAAPRRHGDRFAQSRKFPLPESARPQSLLLRRELRNLGPELLHQLRAREVPVLDEQVRHRPHHPQRLVAGISPRPAGRDAPG